ncbi:helix-turn-helix transcriptional regulator [Kibdelosporangium persicum]|uniref:Transcriptional regulator n=1 Tax=Kibdelosporangium persicum TaxID=2698649 RepID=A0ABX2F0D0_9PSEU|nr:helix-turn-helix transcriptional regulator [Kibdelosporangium persicum]NRN64759.1 Transcriptional regulator [Kibdelosporangium persicum]
MPESATLTAWELGLRLKQRRENLDLSVASVAKQVKMQQPNLSSVETGRKRITQENLAKLCKLYEFSAHESKELQELRIATDKREWYHKYSGMFSEDFVRYIGLEAGAGGMLAYQGALVPGLLQTREYAREVIRGGAPYIRLTELEPRVETRMLRQQRLFGKDALRFTGLLGEPVLRQEVGGREVMHRQLRQLVTLMSTPNIDIQVLPYSAGAHPALGGPFAVLTFDSPWLPPGVWQETLNSTAFIDKPQVVREYTVALSETRSLALSAADSLELIREVAKEMA